ncbi:MAG: hypothetical protein RLZZ67_370 [Candidatus Parcubacteria bacterium]|jgi:leader peptidase (prepilin peptidase)/N-methyltransferase
MDYFILLSLALFGLIIGSFLNVVILRFDTGASISKGRSKCFSCAKTLSWYELIPVLSFVAQKGRCRGCMAKISWQYPLVEFLGAISFPLAYLVVPSAFVNPIAFSFFALVSIVLCLYIVICIYDMRHKIIPDVFSYTAAGITFVTILLEWYATGHIDMMRLIAGPVLFLFFFFFWAVSKGTWMGLGDAKLALSIGWFLGLWQGIAAVLMSFWIGAAVSLIIMLLQKLGLRKHGLGMKSEIPFGPYILLGFLISFMWGIDMQTILLFLTV